MSAIYVTGISRCRNDRMPLYMLDAAKLHNICKICKSFYKNHKTIKLLEYTFHDAVNNAIGVAFDCVWVCVSNVVETP